MELVSWLADQRHISAILLFKHINKNKQKKRKLRLNVQVHHGIWTREEEYDHITSHKSATIVLDSADRKSRVDRLSQLQLQLQFLHLVALLSGVGEGRVFNISSKY